MVNEVNPGQAGNRPASGQAKRRLDVLVIQLNQQHSSFLLTGLLTSGIVSA
jgi:hypothetical protein